MNENKQNEPVAWQFFQDGKWHNGMDIKNHRTNTEVAGFPTRDLYTHPAPAVAQEPVGYQFRTRPVHHRGKGWGSWEPCDKQLFDACIKIPVNNDLEFEVRKVYAESPAVAVNEQMYNALKMVMDDPQSLEGRPRTFECVTEAIGAYEAAKKGGEM